MHAPYITDAGYLHDLRPYDLIQPEDQWSPDPDYTGEGLWFDAWPEDVGLTVAQAEERAREMGEASVYRWRGYR